MTTLVLRKILIVIGTMTPIIFDSCTTKNSDSNQKENSLPRKKLINYSVYDNLKTKPINFIDDRGKKQGRWETKTETGEVYKIETYKDDTLDGYYCLGNANWRDEGNCKAGKKEGIWRTFSGKYVHYFGSYNNGKSIWFSADGSDTKYIIPQKGFSILGDSVYIIAPHSNGKKWYEGAFVNRKIKHRDGNYCMNCIQVGVHKVYFDNGVLRGVVDYDKQKIREYDINGKLMYSTILDSVNIHGQVIDLWRWKNTSP